MKRLHKAASVAMLISSATTAHAGVNLAWDQSNAIMYSDGESLRTVIRGSGGNTFDVGNEFVAYLNPSSYTSVKKWTPTGISTISETPAENESYGMLRVAQGEHVTYVHQGWHWATRMSLYTNSDDSLYTTERSTTFVEYFVNESGEVLSLQGYMGGVWEANVWDQYGTQAVPIDATPSEPLGVYRKLFGHGEGLVAWGEDSCGDCAENFHSIVLWDSATGIKTIIDSEVAPAWTQEAGEDGAIYTGLAMSGTSVAYVKKNGDDQDLYLYNGVSTQKLTQGMVVESLQFSGGKLAWQAHDGNDTEIYFYNGARVIRVTDNDTDDTNPDLSEGFIAYLHDDGNDTEIMLWNGLYTQQITDNGVDDEEIRLYVTPGYQPFGFMSFEDASRPWSTVSGQEMPTTDTNATTGNLSLAVGCGWTDIESPAFDTLEFDVVGDKLSVDIFIPNDQSNPYWVGGVELLFHAPGAGFNNEWLQHADLTNLPRGTFSTLTFDLPQNVQDALIADNSGVHFRFSTNVNSCNSPLLLDSVRFSGNELSR